MDKSKKIDQIEANYLVKDYRFLIDEAEILIADTVEANAIKFVIFNAKISYRIVKTDFSDATVLFCDT